MTIKPELLETLRQKRQHLLQTTTPEKLEALRAKRVLTDPAAQLDNRRIELDHARDRLIAAQERGVGRTPPFFLVPAVPGGYRLSAGSSGWSVRRDGSSLPMFQAAWNSAARS